MIDFLSIIWLFLSNGQWQELYLLSQMRDALSFRGVTDTMNKISNSTSSRADSSSFLGENALRTRASQLYVSISGCLNVGYNGNIVAGENATSGCSVCTEPRKKEDGKGRGFGKWRWARVGSRGDVDARGRALKGKWKYASCARRNEYESNQATKHARESRRSDKKARSSYSCCQPRTCHTRSRNCVSVVGSVKPVKHEFMCSCYEQWL